MFGKVADRVSGAAGVRTREGVVLLVGEWLLRCVVQWKEVSSRLMWVRVRIEQESWVFISTHERGCERSEVEIQEKSS